jgi:NitT/TauT family transport system substrate-binding protein
MMNKHILSFVFTLSVIVTLIVCNIAQAAAAAESMTLKIGFVVPWIGYGPLYIARDKGYFKDEGVQIEFVSLKYEAGAGFAAMATKQIDGAPGTLDETPLYWKADTPFAAVLAFDDSSGGDGILVKKNVNVHSIKELKGKTIAMQKNTPSDFLLNYLLQQNGMSEADVKLNIMSPEDAATAVVASKVEVAVTFNPYLSKAMQDPTIKLLITSKETPGLIADVLIFRKDVLMTKPEAVKRLIRAWNKGVAYQKANPDDAAVIMAKALGYEKPEDVKVDLGGVTLYGKERNAQFFSGSGPGTALATGKFAIELWTTLGRLKTPVKAEDLIDAAYLEK